MEYVKVTFPTQRFVYVNGERGGYTNAVLRVAAGTHEFTLGTLMNFEPELVKVQVVGTSVLKPLEIAFAQKAP